jgi:hypothetical protein
VEGGAARSRTSVLFLSAAILALVCAPPLHAQMSVRPGVIEVASAGTAETATIEVRNEGTAPMNVQLVSEDYDRDRNGEHSYAAFGTEAHSCASRMHVFPEALALAPGEARRVQVRMEPGTQVCWATVWVRKAELNESGGMTIQRVGVKVFGGAPGASRQGEIRQVAVREDSTGRHVDFTFANTGTAPLSPSGTLQVRTYDGNVVAASPIQEFLVLPGHIRTLSMPLEQALAARDYLALPVLDFGADYLAGGQIAFTVRTDDVLFAQKSTRPADRRSGSGERGGQR